MERKGQENLQPVRTKEEARKRGRNGGIKSGEARRKRKTLREELLALLGTEDYQKKISLAMLQEAKAGNTKAFEVIRDTIGEKPKDKVEIDQDKPFEVNINIKKKCK